MQTGTITEAVLRSSTFNAMPALTSGEQAQPYPFTQCMHTNINPVSTTLCSYRVMVLDAGELREFDSPTVLMTHEGGVFRGLMKEATR